MRVVWTQAALAHVWPEYDCLAEINPRPAVLLAQSLFAAGDGLAILPDRGRLVTNTGLRELAVASAYIIRCRRDGETVVILPIRHAARQPTQP